MVLIAIVKVAQVGDPYLLFWVIGVDERDIYTI